MLAFSWFGVDAENGSCIPCIAVYSFEQVESWSSKYNQCFWMEVQSVIDGHGFFGRLHAYLWVPLCQILTLRCMLYTIPPRNAKC